jgi:hypothetical protein
MSVKQLPYQFTNSVLLRFRCCFAISGYGLFCEDLFRNLVLLRVISETAFGWSLTAWTHCRRPSSLSLGIVQAIGVPHDRFQAAEDERKEGAGLPLQLRAISVRPAVAARLPDRERRRSRGAAMKITALLVLKPSSSGAGASSYASSGSGSGSEALVLANATDVSHFGYFQRNAAREFIAFVARTVAQRTPPGQRQSVQHEGSLPGTDLFIFLLRCTDPWFARILLRRALRCASSGSLIYGTRTRGELFGSRARILRCVLMRLVLVAIFIA